MIVHPVSTTIMKLPLAVSLVLFAMNVSVATTAELSSFATKILMTAKFVRLFDEHYLGYVAKAGENVTIFCQTDSLPNAGPFRIDPESKLKVAVMESHRVIKVESPDWVNITILRLSSNDSGVYFCNSDTKHLRVIDAEKRPIVVNQQCFSKRLRNLVCLFETNSKRDSFTSWTASFTIRRTKFENMPCDKLEVVPILRGGEEYNMLECELTSRVSINAIYDWNITGSNIYNKKESSMTSMKLDEHIVILGPPSILESITSSRSLRLKVQLFEEDLFLPTYGYPGGVESMVLDSGIRYKLTIVENSSNKEPTVLTFERRNTTNWLTILNLEPSTKYTIYATNQLSVTTHWNIWSKTTQYTVGTQSSDSAIHLMTTTMFPSTLLDSSVLTTMKMTSVFVMNGSYGEYEAKVGDTVSINCDVSKNEEDRYVTFLPQKAYLSEIPNVKPQIINVTDRIIRMENSDWVNMTIHGVSDNDTGIYACSSDRKRLRILDPAQIPDFDYELTYESTTIIQYGAMRDITKLKMTAEFVIKPAVGHTSHINYAGYAARTGDTVTIQCKLGLPLTSIEKSNPSKELDNNEKVPTTDLALDTSGRMTILRDEDWLNITIHGVNRNDTGIYSCSQDSKELTVINPDNPPKILSYECSSYRLTQITCRFLTNTIAADLVTWKVSYSTRENRTCIAGLCKDMPCNGTNLRVVSAGDGRQYDRLDCDIKDYLFVNMAYDWSVTGTNPFVNHTSKLSHNYTTNIVKLEAPTVAIYNRTANSLCINVTLYQKDYLSSEKGQPGFIESATIDYGLSYRVYVHSLLGKDVLTFWRTGPHSTLKIPNLEPYTLYKISVSNQLNHTINPTIWSNFTYITASTIEAIPETAPEYSPYGFMIGKTTGCGTGQQATLFWKGVPEVARKGNGLIISYLVYRADDTPTLNLNDKSALLQQTQYSTLQDNVTGKARAAEVCVDNGEATYEVLPVNSAGIGAIGSRYHIPASAKVLPVRRCDISVNYWSSTKKLLMEWPSLPNTYNYTVFWCKTELGGQCLEEVNWTFVGSERTFEMDSDKKFLRYKFGLSTDGGNGSTSGIIWDKCINHIEEELNPAKIRVEILDLEANVTVEDECILDSRRADSYTLESCRYDDKKKRCLDEETSQTIELCNMKTGLSMKRSSQVYAFWVTSHAGSMAVASDIVIKKTDQKDARVIIGIVVPGAIVVTITTLLIIVYCIMKRKQVKVLQKPKLVLPTNLIPVKEDLEEDGYESEDSSMPNGYSVVTSQPQPVTLDKKSFSKEDMTSGGEYKNVNHLLGTSEPATMVYCPTKMLDQHSGYKYTSEASSIPDSYLKCTGVNNPQEFSLSDQLFYNAESVDGSHGIDLFNFIPSESSNRANKEISDENYEKPDMEDERQNLNQQDLQEEKQPLVDMEKEELGGAHNLSDDTKSEVYPLLSWSPARPDLEYVKATDCVGVLDAHMEYQSNDDISEPPMDVSENTSGDSGYISRIVCLDHGQPV